MKNSASPSQLVFQHFRQVRCIPHSFLCSYIPISFENYVSRFPLVAAPTYQSGMISELLEIFESRRREVSELIFHALVFHFRCYAAGFSSKLFARKIFSSTHDLFIACSFYLKSGCIRCVRVRLIPNPVSVSVLPVLQCRF
jgi:hypothetical protein